MSPPPSRRAVLSSLALASIAGCLEGTVPMADDEPGEGDSPSDPDSDDSSAAFGGSIADRFDCEEASRPSPDVEAGIEVTYEPVDTDADESDDAEPQTYESVGSADYPGPPESFEEGAVRSFLADYEAAYRRNVLVSRHEERLTYFDAKVDGTEVLESAEGITAMYVELHLSDRGVDEAHGPWQGHAPVAAAYAMDETGLVRAEATHSAGRNGDEDVNPLEEGNLVACFD